MEYFVKISEKARILELKQRNMKNIVLTSNTPYPSRKIRRICAYTSQETTKNQGSIFRVPPYPFNYPARRLTMEETLTKFIDEGKHEHEEMEIFIKEFRTSNEILLKERSNLLSELKIEMTSEATPSKEINETRINKNKPPRFEQDMQEKPHDVGVKNKSLSILERTTQPLVKPKQSSIPFLNRKHKGIEDLAADHLSRIENPHMEVLSEREIVDELPDKHLMLLKSKFNDDEPWNGFNFKVTEQQLKKYYEGNINKEDDEVIEFENGAT
ncbi:hypothetical protein Tco_1145037 [Tanacetum coccineum]